MNSILELEPGPCSGRLAAQAALLPWNRSVDEGVRSRHLADLLLADAFAKRAYNVLPLMNHDISSLGFVCTIEYRAFGLLSG